MYYILLKVGKHRASQSHIRLVNINEDEIADQDKKNEQILSFYQSLFPRKVQNQTDKIEAYLELIPLGKLTNEQALSCEGILSEDEVFQSLRSIKNNKSRGNYGLSKEFYECIWNEIKNPFLTSINRAFLN